MLAQARDETFDYTLPSDVVKRGFRRYHRVDGVSLSS